MFHAKVAVLEQKVQSQENNQITSGEGSEGTGDTETNSSTALTSLSPQLQVR